MSRSPAKAYWYSMASWHAGIRRWLLCTRDARAIGTYPTTLLSPGTCWHHHHRSGDTYHVRVHKKTHQRIIFYQNILGSLSMIKDRWRRRRRLKVCRLPRVLRGSSGQRGGRVAGAISSISRSPGCTARWWWRYKSAWGLSLRESSGRWGRRTAGAGWFSRSPLTTTTAQRRNR